MRKRASSVFVGMTPVSASRYNGRTVGPGQQVACPAQSVTSSKVATIMQRAHTHPYMPCAPSPQRFARAVVAVTVLGVVAGCATDQQRTRTEGAAVGALVGAVVGAAVGGRDGAAIGAAVGGAGGLAYGDQQAKKKQEFAEREDALKRAIAQAQQTSRQAREANQGLQREIAALEETVRRLKTQRLAARQRAELAQSARRRTEQANANVNAQLIAVRQEIGRQQHALQRDAELARKAPEETPSAVRLVRAGVDDLQSQERALEQVKAQLALLDSKRAF